MGLPNGHRHVSRACVVCDQMCDLEDAALCSSCRITDPTEEDKLACVESLGQAMRAGVVLSLTEWRAMHPLEKATWIMLRETPPPKPVSLQAVAEKVARGE